MSIVLQAMLFAKEVHKNQVRRYTGDPYAIHLAEVAAYANAFGLDDKCISAAWLHDSIEDRGVTSTEIMERFGSRVAGLVLDLTNPVSPENRAVRKRMARERLSAACEESQIIKIGDILSNTSSIVLHDRKFAPPYLQECLDLVEALGKVPVQISNLARVALLEGLESLMSSPKIKEASL